MLTHNYIKKIVALLLFTGACNPEHSGTSDTDDTDAGSTGGASSTTDEMPATGSTSPAEGTTGEATTTEEPTEADTTGGLDPSASCEAYCEHATECGVESDVAECVDWCIADFEELLADLMGQCGAENEALLNCAAALSCEELSGELESGPCGDELAAFSSCAGIEPESGALP
jgi:hypothetical protein